MKFILSFLGGSQREPQTGNHKNGQGVKGNKTPKTESPNEVKR